MVSLTHPSPPPSPLLRVKHCQFFSHSHLMSFLLLIKVGPEKLCVLCREARSPRVVNSSNIGRGFKGLGDQNKANKNVSVDSGELCRGPRPARPRKPQSRFCFLLGKFQEGSDMIYPRALSLYWAQNISFHRFPLLHTSESRYLRSSVIHDTISLFKCPALWKARWL